MHITKFTQKQIKAIFKHYEREHITKNVIEEKIKDNILVYNEDFIKNYVDSGKYDLTKKFVKSKMLRDYVLDTINERTGRKIKQDQYVLNDIIITQPKEYGQKVNMEFFNKVIDGLQRFEDNKNKKVFKNMVMYAIHQDEQGQPHLHYSYLPIYERDKIRVKENKKKKTDRVYKVNEKERLTCDYLNVAFLESLHPKMEKLTGLHLTNDNGIKKDLSMVEYQKQQELLKQEEKIKDLDTKIENNKSVISEKEKQLENKLLEKENKINDYNKIIDSYDYYYKTHNKIELQKPTELKPKITQNKETEILLNRQQYENMLKQVHDLEFATSNDYNKRTRLKEQYDKEIAEQEKKLENLKNNDFIDYQKTIENQKNTISELNTKINANESKIKGYDKLLKDNDTLIQNQNIKINSLTKGTQKIWAIVDRLKNFILKNSNLTEQQVDRIAEPPSNEREYN